MKKQSILLTIFVLLSCFDVQWVKGDDDKWKIGRGRVLRQMFGGNDKNDANQQQNNARQQPTPAARNSDPRQQPTPAVRPPQGFGPQQTGPQPNRYLNQAAQPQSTNNRNNDPRQNQAANNQRLTPAQQQQQLRWEAQQRAAQQQSTQQRPGQANSFNRGREPNQADPRLGGRNNNPSLQQNSEQGRMGPDADSNRASNAQVSNRRDKRQGPKPVGFGLELKSDRKDQIYISRLDRNGNAETTGLRKGDQILQIGGVDLMSVEEFDEIAKIMQDGDQIELKVQRSGKTADVLLTFGEAPEMPEEGEVPYQGQPSYDQQDPRSSRTAPGTDYDFVPRQTQGSQRTDPSGVPVVNPRAFDLPKPPAERNRPSLHELQLDLDSDFELPPPRQTQNQSGARSILENK